MLATLALAGLGLVAGVLSGLLGIGGGSIMVPVLALALGYSMQLAIGTSLAVIIPIALVGALTHHMHASVDLNATLLMAVGAIIGAVVGAELAHAISAEVLMRIFGIVLLLVSIKMIVGH